MGRPKQQQQAKQSVWDMFSLVQARVCRYYPNDERSAPTRDLSLDGPILRLALTHGIRGWEFPIRGVGRPLAIAEIKAIKEQGGFVRARAFVDFEIDDTETGAERLCLWILDMREGRVEFLSPNHARLQELRAQEIETNRIARAAKKPINPKRTLADRSDVL